MFTAHFSGARSSREEEQRDVRLLPGALRGHHLHRPHQAEDSLLFLQPHRPLSSDRLHGGPGLHSPSGLRGETEFR